MFGGRVAARQVRHRVSTADPGSWLTTTMWEALEVEALPSGTSIPSHFVPEHDAAGRGNDDERSRHPLSGAPPPPASNGGHHRARGGQRR